MINFLIIKYLLIGLVLITLIDIGGSILSRRLHFNYTFLSVLSFFVYTLVGYLSSKQFELNTAIFLTGFLGLYDSTIGHKLAIRFKANTGMEEYKKTATVATIIVMIVIAMLFGLLGYFINQF
ncbi:MAG: hypothetical protein WDN26_08100 [Chitinophagaceae bacterium]